MTEAQRRHYREYYRVYRRARLAANPEGWRRQRAAIWRRWYYKERSPAEHAAWVAARSRRYAALRKKWGARYRKKHNRYNRDFRARRRRHYLLALGGECLICHTTDLAQLQFHHCPRKADSNGETLNFGWSRERIETEVSRCVLLCRACHELSTSAENSEAALEAKIGFRDLADARIDTSEPVPF